MTQSKTKHERFTRREREIMHAIYALGNRASSEAIRERLSHPPGESAVRIMLARLEKKGHVRHESEGLRYLYSATVSRSVARRAMLRHFLETFFAGSEKNLVTSLLAEGSWSREDLAALRAEINRRFAAEREKP